MEALSKESEKEKIRSRYKGISQDMLETIPAVEHVDILHDDREKRVGVYVRVSTDDPRQTSSFELQRNHYTDLVDRYPNWHLYRIYADEGISGTSLRHRKAFLEMIEDCKAHKLDLIVTKSVSRFARNIYHCIGYVRELAALKPPVGVLFETEGLYTLKDESEMALSFTATFAQEESRTRSSAMNLSYEMRFRRGIFMLPKLLGYDKDEDGNLVVNENEAMTVRLIFFMFLYGYTPQQIAETLTELKRPTKKGNYIWSSSSVIGILQNERHCGDVLAHKTWTPNYLDHKAVKNIGNKPQYRQRDHHEGIISRDDYIAAQQLIAHSVTGRTGMLPHLHVIESGALKGLVIVNPRWTGFRVEDYISAAQSVASRDEDLTESIIKAKAGSLDLRGFEVIRGQFFDGSRKCTVHLSHEHLRFNLYSVQKLSCCKQVEFLLDPIRLLLVVRPSHKSERNSIDWSYYDGLKYHPRKITGRAYMPVLYELMGWSADRDYSVQGECRGSGEENLLVFDLRDAEAIFLQFVPKDMAADETNTELSRAASQQVMAMPAEWMMHFGADYYRPPGFPESDPLSWNVRDQGKALPRNDSFRATGEEELKEQIDTIITAFQGDANNG